MPFAPPNLPPETCPNCGAEVPRSARSCPECGADENSGWSETAYASHLGLPDREFDHDEFVNAELSPNRVIPRGLHWFWWLTAALLVGLWLLFGLR